jgi:hypothetical protein
MKTKHVLSRLCGVQLVAQDFDNRFDNHVFDPDAIYFLLDHIGNAHSAVGMGGVVKSGVVFFNSWAALSEPVFARAFSTELIEEPLEAFNSVSKGKRLYIQSALHGDFSSLARFEETRTCPVSVSEVIDKIRYQPIYIPPRASFFQEPSNDSFFVYNKRQESIAKLFSVMKDVAKDVGRLENTLRSEELRLPLDTNFNALARLLSERIERIKTPEVFKEFILQGGLMGIPRTGVDKPDIYINVPDQKYALTMVAAAALACAVYSVCSVANALQE